MTRRLLALAPVIALAWLSAPAAAQRDDFPEAPHFAAKLMLGVGGEAEYEYPVITTKSDMELTWGGGVHYLYPLMKYFAIGGQVAVQSWQTEAIDELDQDSNVWLDLALMPAGTLPVADKVQLYLALPIGVSFDFWGEDPPASEIDTAVGFTVSFLLGARFALSGNLGLLAELGYALHSFEHETQTDIGGITTEWDVDTGQFAIHLGVFF
jgi:Outer membrane protein beta-barrel domain